MTLSIHLSTCWAVFHDYNVSNPPVEGSKTSYRRLAPKSLYKNNSSLKTCNLVLPFLAIQGHVCMLSLFLNQHFSNTLMEKNMSCVKIQVKMLQFHSWTYWKMREQPKTSICWAFGGYSVLPSWWLWEKYIQSPGVFSTSAGTKGHPNKHQRWWGFCSKTQTLKFKYDVCLEPGKISSRCHQIWAARNDSKCMASLHSIQHLSGVSIAHHVIERCHLELSAFFLYAPAPWGT